MSVFAIQRALIQLGYDPGPLDGIMGPLTQAGIRAFQRDRGLQVDAIVGPITSAALNFAIAEQAVVVETDRNIAGTGAGPKGGPGPIVEPIDGGKTGGGKGGGGRGDPIEVDLPGQDPLPPVTGTNFPDPPATSPGLNFLEQTNVLLPWLPSNLASVYASVWADNADPNLALAAVRADPSYDELLPGNRRGDGTFRMTEAEYFSTVDSMNRSLAQINLNPEVFKPMFVNAIQGDVSAREFDARVQTAYRDILVNLPSIRSYYANEFGVDLTDEGIIASFLSPEIGEQVINRRILSSQIGGNAALRGFDLGLNEAGRLAAAGLNQETSAQFFATAARALPSLKAFAQRFNEGTFDLAEFTETSIFGDPEGVRRIERLFAAEAASFTKERNVVKGRRQGQQSGIAVR